MDKYRLSAWGETLSLVFGGPRVNAGCDAALKVLSLLVFSGILVESEPRETLSDDQATTRLEVTAFESLGDEGRVPTAPRDARLLH